MASHSVAIGRDWWWAQKWAQAKVPGLHPERLLKSAICGTDGMERGSTNFSGNSCLTVGGVVIKNTFLSNTDNASVNLRKLMLESCNLHTVLDCPGGAIQGAGVKTVVLFFEKGAPTRKIWYYQLDPGRNLGKTNPLNDDDLTEFVALQKTFADSPKSWSVDAKSIDQTTFDLSVKNPDGGEEVKHRGPQEIIEEIAALDK